MDDKALQMGKSSTAGSFFLLIGTVCSSILLALGTLFLAQVLSADELGSYSVVLIPSSIIAAFRDLGVNSAMTQRIANLRTANKHDEVHDVIVSGVFFEIVSGAVLSIACFVAANYFATLLSHPELSSYIALMSVSIFASALVSAASSIFIGFEKMKLNSFTQMLQAAIKTLLGPLLVILGFSVLGVVWSVILSVVVSGFIGMLLVYFVLFRPLRKLKIGKCNIKQTLPSLLKYGIPLTFSGIAIIVLPYVFTALMTPYVTVGMLGNYTAATYFAVIVTFISVPISTALFPAFSKLNTVTESKLVRTVFASSVKYLSLFLIPISMMLIALAGPLVYTFFPQDGMFTALFTVGAEPKFPYAPVFLVFSSIVNLFVLFGNVVLNAFQIGIGKTKQVMKQSILALVVSVPFAYIVITCFGKMFENEVLVVMGGILAFMVSIIAGMVWGLIWAWKNYRVKADFGNSGKIFIAALVASIVAYVVSLILIVPYVIMLLVGVIIFLLVYIICIPLIGAVNSADLDTLRILTSELGPISKIMSIPLKLMRKLCKKSV